MAQFLFGGLPPSILVCQGVGPSLRPGCVRFHQKHCLPLERTPVEVPIRCLGLVAQVFCILDTF